jgi:Zn-dependent peptidase ImmA (M78 family)
MKTPVSPERAAFDITHVLNAVFGADRFPVDIPGIAMEFSAKLFPDDPIISVKGADLPGFEGALVKSKGKRNGWGIIYNNQVRSPGRINFTLAHELGHYLLHRTAYPEGLTCGEQEVVRWDSEYGQVEQQANVFASNVLMPLDDFRRQIPDDAKVGLDMISHCADRYKVSLIAATLRWLSYTQKRGVIVVSRDGFILWSRASEAALKTRAYFRTSQGPIEIPLHSLPNRRELLSDGTGSIDHEADVWFPEPVSEITLLAEQYDFAISLLLLEDRGSGRHAEVSELDVFDQILARSNRRG